MADREADPTVLLEWLNSGEQDNERVLQTSALDQLCMAILMTENVDRFLEKYTPQQFIPSMARLFFDATAPDKMLEVAARALTYFLDLSTDCGQRLLEVNHGLEAISLRLNSQNITNKMSRDLSEQVVKIFEKLCQIRAPIEATDPLYQLISRHSAHLHGDTIKSALIVFRSICSDPVGCAQLARYDLSPLLANSVPLVTQKVMECLPVLIEHGAAIPMPVPPALCSQPDILSRIVHDRIDVDPRLLFGIENQPLDQRLADSMLGVVFECKQECTNGGWTNVHREIVAGILNNLPDISIFDKDNTLYETVNALNDNRETLLSWAASFGTAEHVKFLLNRGANPRLGRGGSALHTAAYMNNKSVYGLLLVNGASPDAVDARGLTPYELATASQVESQAELLAECAIWFRPGKTLRNTEDREILNRLMQVRSDRTSGLRIVRRLFSHLDVKLVLELIDSNEEGRRLMDNILKVMKRRFEDPEAYLSCLMLIESLLVMSRADFLSRFSRIGVIRKVKEEWKKEMNASEPIPQYPSMPFNPANLSALPSTAIITNGPYTFGSWRLVEVSGFHLTVWHESLQLAVDLARSRTGEVGGFQFRFKADGRLGGVDGPTEDTTANIPLSSFIEFVHRLDDVRYPAGVSTPHKIDSLFRSDGTSNQPKVRTLDCGVTVQWFRPASADDETEHLLIWVADDGETSEDNDMRSVIRIDPSGTTVVTPAGFIASWNKYESSTTYRTSGALSVQQLMPAAMTKIHKATIDTLKRINQTHIASSKIRPSKPANRLERILRRINTTDGFDALVNILQSGDLSTYELSMSSLLRSIGSLDSFESVRDPRPIVRSIVSILDNAEDPQLFPNILTIASPSSIGNASITFLNNTANTRRRRRSIDIRSLSSRIKINVTNANFERPYTMYASPFICIAQLEQCIRDRFVRNWFSLALSCPCKSERGKIHFHS